MRSISLTIINQELMKDLRVLSNLTSFNHEEEHKASSFFTSLNANSLIYARWKSVEEESLKFL